MSKRRSAHDLQEDADSEVLIVSDSLREQLGDAIADHLGQPIQHVECVVYYQVPSPGIAGRLLRFKRSKASARLVLEIPQECLSEALSCPEFIRMVVSVEDRVAYEIDFVEPWAETERELAVVEGRIELHISLAECDT